MQIKGRRGNPGIRGRLLQKSVDAYVLSLETINRLSVQYRIEAFCYLLCNAWELLLKARVVDQTGGKQGIYFKKKHRNEPDRTKSLEQCISEVYPNERDPIRRNLEYVVKLRNMSTHYFVSQVPKNVLGLLQACVLNYHNELVTWFGISLKELVPVGMMTIVYDFAPDAFDVDRAALKTKLGKDTFDNLMAFQQEVQQERLVLGDRNEFSLIFSYDIFLEKAQGEADITVTRGGEGVPVVPVYVARDLEKTHPYIRNEVVTILNERLGGTTSINSHDIEAVNVAHRVQNRPDFYWKSNREGRSPQYSDSYIEWVLVAFKSNPQFFQDARRKYKQQREQAKKNTCAGREG